MQPAGTAEVFGNLILQAVDNPVHAIASGNYISILVWAIAMGAVLRQSHSSTREVLLDAAKTVEFIVRLVIRFAPFGIFGIVASTLATTGLQFLWDISSCLPFWSAHCSLLPLWSIRSWFG